MKDLRGNELEILLDCVEKVFMVKKDRIKSRTRKMDAVYARHAFCLISRDATNKTLQEIGNTVNRNHTTILYAEVEARSLAEQDRVFEAKVEICKQVFQQVMGVMLNESRDQMAEEIVDSLRIK